MSAPRNERLKNKQANFVKALDALQASLATPIAEPRDLSGIIKDFEIVYELSWTLLKTFLETEGHETRSAKDAFAKAFQLGYISDQEVWLRMISDRNLTVHTYDENLAQELFNHIRDNYLSAFQSLRTTLAKPEASTKTRE